MEQWLQKIGAVRVRPETSSRFGLEGMIMAKGVKVTVFLSVKSDQIAALLAMILGLQSETLSRPGARSTEALQSGSSHKAVVYR
jgi:hypothetical protein